MPASRPPRGGRSLRSGLPWRAAARPGLRRCRRGRGSSCRRSATVPLSRVFYRLALMVQRSMVAALARVFGAHAVGSRCGGVVCTHRPLRNAAISLLVLMSIPSVPVSDERSAGGDGLRPPKKPRAAACFASASSSALARVRPGPVGRNRQGRVWRCDGNSMQFALPLAQLKRPHMFRARPSHKVAQSVRLRDVGLLVRPQVPRPATGNGPNSVWKTQKGERIVAVSSKCFKPLKKSGTARSASGARRAAGGVSRPGGARGR